MGGGTSPCAWGVLECCEKGVWDELYMVNCTTGLIIVMICYWFTCVYVAKFRKI